MSGHAAGAQDWLRAHEDGVPPALTAAMADALGAAGGAAPGAGAAAASDELAAAALGALARALEQCNDRTAALPLLAADALVTYACEAAATEQALLAVCDALRPERLSLHPGNTMDAGTIAALHAARLAEKRQALYYRALASLAEDVGDEALSERLNGLHADEQHHLSRLTVRLVEANEAVADLGGERIAPASLDGWEADARAREQEELARYAALLDGTLDDRTRIMLEEFLEAERHHADVLGGKWMGA